MYVHKDCPTPAARNWEGVLDGIYLNGSSPMSFNPSEFSKRDFVPDGDFHEGGVVDTINRQRALARGAQAQRGVLPHD